jgi:hypothetical protein
MRYHLRTLLIVLAMGSPALAGMWPFVRTLFTRREIPELDKFRHPISGNVLIELYMPNNQDER